MAVALGEKRTENTVRGSTPSPSGSRRARTIEWCTCARFFASSLPGALTLFQLEKVNCARGFEEKPSTELQGTTGRSSGSRRARTNEWCTCARFVASSLPKALTLFQLEKVNCARCVPRQAFPRSPWPIGVAK